MKNKGNDKDGKIEDFVVLKNILVFFENEGITPDIDLERGLTKNQMRGLQKEFINGSIEKGIENIFDVIDFISLDPEIFLPLENIKTEIRWKFHKFLEGAKIYFSSNGSFDILFNFYTESLFIDYPLTEEMKEILCSISPGWEIKVLFLNGDKIKKQFKKEMKKLVLGSLEQKSLLERLIKSINDSVYALKLQS
ncbi:hypothetical protein AAGG74_15725 [Bacillus mexicanus]|uniref:hypothetical protein n=1 Tax=Bacillus mexicanus TaxID=2834415 RepID=UPI003D20F62A